MKMQGGIGLLILHYLCSVPSHQSCSFKTMSSVPKFQQKQWRNRSGNTVQLTSIWKDRQPNLHLHRRLVLVFVCFQQFPKGIEQEETSKTWSYDQCNASIILSCLQSLKKKKTLYKQFKAMSFRHWIKTNSGTIQLYNLNKKQTSNSELHCSHNLSPHYFNID